MSKKKHSKKDEPIKRGWFVIDTTIDLDDAVKDIKDDEQEDGCPLEPLLETLQRHDKRLNTLGAIVLEQAKLIEKQKHQIEAANRSYHSFLEVFSDIVACILCSMPRFIKRRYDKYYKAMGLNKNKE